MSFSTELGTSIDKSYGALPIEVFEIKVGEDDYLRLANTVFYGVDLELDEGWTEFSRFPVERGKLENRLGMDEHGGFSLNCANYNISILSGGLSLTGDIDLSLLSGSSLQYLSDLLDIYELRGKEITIYFALLKYLSGENIVSHWDVGEEKWRVPIDFWHKSFVGIIESAGYNEEIINFTVVDKFAQLNLTLPKRLHTFLCPWRYRSKYCLRGETEVTNFVDDPTSLYFHCRKTYEDCVLRWAEANPSVTIKDKVVAGQHFGGFLHLADIQTKRVSGY